MVSHRMKLAWFAACTVGAFALTTGETHATAESENPREVARLRAHFDSVLRELRAADVGTPTASQSLARQTLIRRLEQYAAAGRFPHNHVRAEALVPVFRDEHGTLCAMAYLIASTGRTDIVDQVARTNNLAYIPELAGSAKLRAWLDSTGLTVAEAARIQPQYGGCCTIEPSPAAPPTGARRDYAVGSALATVGSGTFLSLTLARGDATKLGRVTTWMGLAFGAAQAVHGAAGTSYRDSRQTVGIANIAVGGAAIAGSVWRMRHPRKTANSPVAVSVQPLIAPQSAGLLLTARM